MKYRLDSGSNTWKIKNVSIDGFRVNYSFIANAAANTPTGADLDKLSIKAILHQDGMETELINSTLLPLHVDAVVQNPQTIATQQVSTAGIYAGSVTITQTGAIAGQNRGITPIVFGGGIVLKEGDYIELKVKMQAGFFGSNCNTNSYVEFVPNEVVTNQLVVPRITVFSIPTSENTFTRSIGDNVQTLSVVNIDDTAGTEDVAPFTAVSLTSDKLKIEKDWSEIRAENAWSRVAYATNPSAVLLRGKEFDRVELSIDLDTANLTDSMNYVVVRHFDFDGEIYQKGVRRAQKHQLRGARKFGL